MALLIPGEKKPQGCGFCIFLKEILTHWNCVLMNEFISEEEFEWNRHPICQLIEIDENSIHLLIKGEQHGNEESNL